MLSQIPWKANERFYLPVKVAIADRTKFLTACRWQRYGHTLVSFNHTRKLYLFGGYSTICADYCKDLWEYEIDTNTWRSAAFA